MIHILHFIANNSSVPYFKWFAELSATDKNVKLSFAMLLNQRPTLIDEMKKLGIEVHWIYFDRTKRSVSMLRAIPKLYALMQRLNPDVVHTHLFDDSLPALFAGRLARVPVRVITKQDTAFHWYYAPKAVKYDRLNNKNATHIVAVSEECKEFILEKEKADPAKVHLIHHGIPIGLLTHQTEETRTLLRSKYNPNSKMIIGTVARIIEWKGYRYIIEAAAKLVKKHPGLHFLFAGEGAQKGELELLIKEKGLGDSISFTGLIDRQDIPSFYGIMDIYLHAAFMEPFGFVIAEAMANGVPVVSTPTGAARDSIRDGENGMLVRYKDPDSIVAGIERLLTLSHDERKRMGEKARQTVFELFRVEKTWENYLRLYRDAANKK
ncbi:MAG TPA: glycosyltransferase family 4 protein [Bacteroidia bacterium]|nr:glycosyltransferase family 4 protein [Bacteroidia bacterium]